MFTVQKEKDSSEHQTPTNTEGERTGGWVRAPIPTEGAVTQQFQTAGNWSCHSNALLVSSCHPPLLSPENKGDRYT